MDTAKWALLVAAASFTVSLLLAFREFTARPILVVWTWQVSVRREGHWQFGAHAIHIANVGRAPAIVTGVGLLRGTGAEGYIGQVEFAGHLTPNPGLPLTLPPGEVATFMLPAPRFAEDAGPLGVQSLRRRRLRIRDGERLAKIVTQIATEVVEPPEVSTP